MIVTPGAALLVSRHVCRVSQRVDRLRPICRRVEPSVVQLQENPLRPPVIIGIGRVDFPAPVVAEAKRLNLALEVGDVGLGGDARMLAGLDRVLLCRQAERVPPDRVEHVETAHALVAGEDIGGGVAFRVADMQPRARRVREHVEDVIFRDVAGVRVRVTLVERMVGWDFLAGVPRPERLTVMPRCLPLRLENLERILSAHGCG